MTQPPPKPRWSNKRGEETTKLRVPFEKTRWRYQKDGRDFGPWSGREMLEHLWDEKIDAETQVYEEWNERWYRAGSVPKFAQELSRIQRDNESRALEHEASKTGEAVRSARKRHWGLAIAAIASIIAAIVAITVLDTDGPHEPGSAALKGLYVSLSIPSLAPSDFTAQPNEAASAPQKEEKSTKRERRKRANSARLLGTSGSGALAYSSGAKGQSLDFTAQASPEEQSRFERRVQRRVQGMATPLTSCADRELKTHGKIQSGKFIFQVSKQGRISEARVVNSGRVSPAFLRCVKGAVTKFQVEPYTGSSIRVNYRLRVSSHSEGDSGE